MAIQECSPSYLNDQRDAQMSAEDWNSPITPLSMRTMRFEVNRLLRLVRPAEILNVGCGCGFHDVEMARRHWVRRIDSLDCSSGLVAKANELFSGPKIRRSVTNFLRQKPCPLYDCVVSFQVIEHIENPAEFFRRCVAWCKPGGHVAVYTLNAQCPIHKIEAVHEISKPKIILNMEQLERLGVYFGLTPKKMFGYLAASPRRPHWVRLWQGYWFPQQSERLGVLFHKPHA
jgi:2-polyprenyl-3-methyl-5-hydroxy-6-metoxy-1,4-benzoquinol methylase